MPSNVLNKCLRQSLQKFKAISLKVVQLDVWYSTCLTNRIAVSEVPFGFQVKPQVTSDFLIWASETQFIGLNVCNYVSYGL